MGLAHDVPRFERRQRVDDGDEVGHLAGRPARRLDSEGGAHLIGERPASPSRSFDEVDEIVSYLAESAVEGDHIVVMSNSGFGGIHDKLLRALKR